MEATIDSDKRPINRNHSLRKALPSHDGAG
jgi:hypothetical protein